MHLGNDGNSNLGETGWLYPGHTLMPSFFFASCAVTTLLSGQLSPISSLCQHSFCSGFCARFFLSAPAASELVEQPS